MDAGATAAAAAAAATAAADLAGWRTGGPIAPPGPPSPALLARVRALAACVLGEEGGGGEAGCPLARALLGPAGAAALASDAPFSHLGPLATIGPDPQAPPIVSTGARFLWEALARAAAGGGPDGARKGPRAVTPCRSAADCQAGDGAPWVCAGTDAGAGGRPGVGACTSATVRFVAAYPLGLECAGCADGDGAWGEWRVVEGGEGGGARARAWAAAHAWPAEPLWCESLWPAGGVPSLTLYRTSPVGSAGRAWAGGLAATAAAAWAGRAAGAGLARAR